MSGGTTQHLLSSEDKVRQLVDALTVQNAAMVALVQATQTEQAHLLAYEIKELAHATNLRAEALEAVGRCNETTSTAFEAARAGDVSVTALAKRLGHTQLAVQASTLRALAEALSELNALTLVHAKRSSQTARAYASLLTRDVGGGGRVPSAYNRSGRATNAAPAPASIVIRSL